MIKSKTHKQMRWLTMAVIAVIILIIFSRTVWGQENLISQSATIAKDISCWAGLPFVLLVLSHAILPALPWTRAWYNKLHHRLMITAVLSLAVIFYYGWWYPQSPDMPARSVHLESILQTTLQNYVSLLVMVLTLFVVCSGIGLRGTLPPYPLINTLLLLMGTVLAGFIGTLAASLLMIWVVLKTNQARKHAKHTMIFYIFLVGNIGGCLLASGDHALMLGYLWGRPFGPTMASLLTWMGVSAALLMIYFFIEVIAWRTEKERDIWQNPPREALSCGGWINLFWLAGVVVVLWLWPSSAPTTAGPTQAGVPVFAREMVLLLLLALSRWTTPPAIRQELRPFYGVLLEIAVWFGGLLITVQIPMEILGDHAGKLPLSQPWQMFWACGALSSFLDNSAVYALMHTVWQQKHLAAPDAWTAALTQGVVFFGAMTYIGNGNNYLIKSIAQRAGIVMPSFWGYFIYSMIILLPVWMGLTVAMRWMFGLWG